MTTPPHLLRLTIAGAAGALVYLFVLGPYAAAIGVFAIPFITAAGAGFVRRWCNPQE